MQRFCLFQWASAVELQRAAGAGARLLRYVASRPEAAAPLELAIIAAARAALPIRPETTAAIITALASAEAGAAGLHYYLHNGYFGRLRLLLRSV